MPGVATRTLLPSTLKTVSASGTYSFRGSITRPGDTLCTLRSQGRPCTTQHSVPAGCQPLPGRINPCRVPSGVFSQIFLYMTYLSSRLCLAHFQQNRPIAAPCDFPKADVRTASLGKSSPSTWAQSKGQEFALAGTEMGPVWVPDGYNHLHPVDRNHVT